MSTTSETDWAERLYASQKLNHGGPYLRGEPKPTRNQVSAVLHALADHTGIVHMIEEADELGADRAHLGEMWRQSTGIGRYLQALGDALDTPANALILGAPDED